MATPIVATNDSLDAVDLAEQVRSIRRALLIGLDSFGEVERLIDVFDTYGASPHYAFPEASKPVHPTGGANTIGVFADALRLLEHFEPSLEVSKEVAHG